MVFPFYCVSVDDVAEGDAGEDVPVLVLYIDLPDTEGPADDDSALDSEGGHVNQVQDVDHDASP